MATDPNAVEVAAQIRLELQQILGEWER